MPLGRKIAFRTEATWPSKVLMQLKSPTAHSFTVPSADAVATHCKSEETHISNTRQLGVGFAPHLVYRRELNTPQPSPVPPEHSLQRPVQHTPQLEEGDGPSHQNWRCMGNEMVYRKPGTFAVLSCEPVTISLSLGETSRELMSYRRKSLGDTTVQ